MQFIFMTFGSGKAYENNLSRIRKQAEDMNVFDRILTYNRKYLMEMPDFWEKNAKFIDESQRGYGYWIWKPYLIHYVMENIMKPGDILVYCDCGSTLYSTGKSRLFSYFSHAINARNGILGFELSYPEKKYTKADVFEKLDCKNLEDTKQIMATAIILCKKEGTHEIIKKWYETCVSDNYRYVDDNPSSTPNSDIFIENRHDQSIYSLVLKMDGGTVLLGEETEINGPSYPIWNSRLR